MGQIWVQEEASSSSTPGKVSVSGRGGLSCPVALEEALVATAEPDPKIVLSIG